MSLLICVFAIAMCGIADAVTEVVEDFEGYSNTTQMNAAWVPITNPSEVSRTLDASNGVDGSQAMRWTYPGSPPTVEWWVWSEYTFDTPQDWTPFYNGQLILKYKALSLATNYGARDWLLLGLYIYDETDTIIYPLDHTMEVTGSWDEAVINIPEDKWSGSYASVKKIRIGVCHETWLDADVLFDNLTLSKAGIVINQSNNSTDVGEEGPTSDSYTVKLGLLPTDNVTVLIQDDGQTTVDIGSGSVQSAELLFTPSDWNTEQTVTVTAIDDGDNEGDHVSQINHTTDSNDQRFNDGTIVQLQANVADNDGLCGIVGTRYLEADLNKDCYVDLLDFALMASRWLQCTDPFYPDKCILIGEKSFAELVKTGHGTQVDITYPYYQGASTESITSELELNGCESVQYHIQDESVHLAPHGSEFLSQCHKRGIGVVAVFFATCVYNPTSVFPEGWQDWRVEFTRDPGSLTHLSPVHQAYRDWMKERLGLVFSEYDFDGFNFHEAFWPIYNLVGYPVVRYADVSAAFQAAFMADTGNTNFPNFSNPSDPHWYQTDVELYEDLVQYRVDVLNDFYDDIVNGFNGLRTNFPDLVIGTWTLVDTSDSDMSHMRECQGQDAAAMVAAVQPDYHFFQTNGSDWSRNDLPPDYAWRLQPFTDSVKQQDPDIPLGLQTDLNTSGSGQPKSTQWHKDFTSYTNEAGIDATTYTEFSLRWKIYFGVPEVKRVTGNGSTLKVFFDQRIDPAAASLMVGRTILDFKLDTSYTVPLAA
jgi:hypothetical protein